MSFFGWVKAKTLRTDKEVTKPQYNAEIPPETPLDQYEIRRQEVAEQTAPIEGIFYLYQNRIICDHYSEWMEIEAEESWRKKHMYHRHFYRNYMVKKYPGLTGDPEEVPRGRVSLFGTTAIFLDACYSGDQELIEKIKALYRLSEPVLIVDEYNCNRCRPES